MSPYLMVSLFKITFLMSTLLMTACTPTGVLNALSGTKQAKIEEDIAYGTHSRQKLDRYSTNNNPSCRIIFIYGGSWQEGNKEKYGFIGAQLAKSGYLVSIPDYRLHPEVSFPAFVDDVALSIAFELQQNKYGENLPLVLIGHSAGAQIAALLSYDPNYFKKMGIDNNPISALITLAGPHDYFLPSEKPIWTEIFGEDKTKQKSALPVNNVDSTAPPTLILHGDKDDIVTPKSAQSLNDALKAVNVTSSLKIYPDVGIKKYWLLSAAHFIFWRQRLKTLIIF